MPSAPTKPGTASAAKPTITLADLRAKGACASALAEFEALFPSGSVVVTVAKARKVADRFSWEWAAAAFLKATARADYDRMKATALADYERVRAPAWADFDRVRATAWATAYIAQGGRGAAS